MADIFVSYARNDRARVAPLVAALEAKGWSVWWDPEIIAGQEFDSLIAEQLKAAAAILVVWTPDSVASRWVRGEAREGAERGILVPVRFERADLPIDVRALHTTDFDDWQEDPDSPQVQEVLRALGGIISRGRAPEALSSHPAPHASQGVPSRVAICVLPFMNIGDPEQDYFSDGITEDIITELSRWRLLAVRSRSASFRYRGSAVDLKQVARELNVRFIVEGSVRRMGTRIRISAQLIDHESGRHIWGEKFDREWADLYAVQDQLVRTIVSTLVGRFQVSDVERARRKPSSNLAAYECVLKGNALPWDDPDRCAEAHLLFEKAIEIDPGYAHAYALLAALCWTKWQDDPSDSDAALAEGIALAQRAVALDKNESSCFSLLGFGYLLRRSFDLAVQHGRRAIELNPSNQWNAADLGTILQYVGQAEESLTLFKRAREIDPYFDEPWYWSAVGRSYMVLHRYQEALAAFDYLSARTYRVCAYMAGCYARLADTERAQVSAAECLAKRPNFSIEHFVSKHPFQNPSDAAHLSESLALAGLPKIAEALWVDDVITFWFQELGANRWFAKDETVDALIRDRFLTLHKRLVTDDCAGVAGARPILAAVIVMDQFSRNIFRDDPRAFSADFVARRLTRAAIEQRFDTTMEKAQRYFLYLPFEHSEYRDDQALAVKLIESLGNAEWTSYASAHQVIIDRFGRFPHRNAVLKRTSTPEEITFLKQPHSSF